MRRGLAALIVAATLAGCQQREVQADGAWVRLPAVSGRPGAAYFNIHGGSEGTALLAVSTPAAIRAELHEMKHQGDMMTMSPLKDVAIPAGTTVKFEPGGKHVMLYEISPSVRAGTRIPLRLAFADGKTVELTAEVKAVGQAE